MKQSKEYVENQGKLYESKQERYARLMKIFDKTVQTEKLELESFNF